MEMTILILKPKRFFFAASMAAHYAMGALRAHGQAGPEGDQPAHLSVRPYAVSMATCVMGMYAVGPEYRPAWHADGRITLQRCPSSVTTITFSVSAGIPAMQVPGPVAGISPMLGSAVIASYCSYGSLPCHLSG